MLSKRSRRPEVRASFEKFLEKNKNSFDAICLAESSSQNVDISKLLPGYKIYESKLKETYLYKLGYKFVIAYKDDCIVKPIPIKIEDSIYQKFINSSYNEGYCSEQLFSIKRGGIEVVAVHIQTTVSDKNMKELSQYSQDAGLAKLSTYMKNHSPAVVVGDFNLHENDLIKKFEDNDFDIEKSDYSFAKLADNDVSGREIHHALINEKSNASVEYINEVQTHLTTAMYIEVKE